jgi:hypothetical protein
MHVRFTLITADPERIDDAVAYLASDGRMRLQSEPGERGMSLQVAPDLAVAVVESFWVSHDALRESEHVEAAVRDEAAQRAVGTASVERFRVASTSRIGREESGAGVRHTVYQTLPSDLDRAVAGYEDTAVPWLIDTDGFVSATVLVDHRTGRQISQTIWHDLDALVKSRSPAAAIRRDAVAATDTSVVGLDEYGLVFRSARDE